MKKELKIDNIEKQNTFQLTNISSSLDNIDKTLKTISTSICYFNATNSNEIFEESLKSEISILESELRRQKISKYMLGVTSICLFVVVVFLSV